MTTQSVAPSWRENPSAALVQLAWPLTISMLSNSLMTLIDTLFVGRLGAASLAAVGIGGVVAFTVMCFGFGTLRAVKVLVSQAVGADREDRQRPYLGASFVIVGVLSRSSTSSAPLSCWRYRRPVLRGSPEHWRRTTSACV